MADYPEEPPDHHEQQLRRKLERLRRLYVETKNPLYAWEAILNSLATPGEETIPKWCVPYFRRAALRLTTLASCRDFRPNRRKNKFPPHKITDKQAMRRLSEALAFSRQGKRNAFADLKQDRDFIGHERKNQNAKPWVKVGPIKIRSPRQTNRLQKRGKRLARAGARV